MSWLKAMREKEPPEPTNPIGTVVIGTLEPDIMTTAKDMVRRSLKLAQFKALDVGRGVSPETFASKAKEANADILVVSVLYSKAKKNLPKLMSALEIEAVLLQHPAIRECAVVGVPDDTWGEAVAVAAVLDEGEELSLDSLRAWCRDQLSHYKIPGSQPHPGYLTVWF